MPMMEKEKIDNEIAFLQKTSTVTGGTVYKDLARVIGQILLEKPENAVDLLETAFLVKKAAYSPSDPTAIPEPKATEKVSAIRGLYVTPEPEVDPETGAPEPAQPPNDYTGEDLLDANDLFAAVGVGLGPIHTYQVAMATQRLGENPELQLASVRFFGKIFGSKGDYYVFEATLKEPNSPPETETVPPMEVGTGANAFVYFVQPYPGGPTTKLPDVTPAQMLASRLQKRYLTGGERFDWHARSPERLIHIVGTVLAESNPLASPCRGSHCGGFDVPAFPREGG